MAEPVHEALKCALSKAEGAYYRLVLLVGESGAGKTAALNALAEELGVPVINANLALSSELLELTNKQRSLRLPGILDQIAGESQDLVIMDNLEILFDVNLEQDPLRLLQGVSRNRTVLASWSGRKLVDKLLYAQNGHPEYRSYDSVDALIVDITNSQD